jgi:WD40-like Beta Propeller Repeat
MTPPFLSALLLTISLIFLPQNRTEALRDVLVFDLPSNDWFEGPLTGAEISPDATWALFTRGLGHTHLYALPSGREDPETLRANLDRLDISTFCGATGFLRFGARGKDVGVFAGLASPKLTPLPRDAFTVCSATGNEMAYFHVRDPESGIFLGIRGDFQQYPVSGEVTAMAFSPDNRMFYYLAFHPDGESSLSSIEVRTGKTRLIASRLDASPVLSRMAVAPNSKQLFLALASDGPPDNEARHNPSAERWLKIYELDLATGRRRVVVDSPGQDNNAPEIVDNNLYWTRTVFHDSIVTIPIAGGNATEIVEGGELPAWSPDGTRIAYTFGGWRLADWALNLDDAVISVDRNAHRSSDPSVIVSGYHEDFPPSWSPDGKWIAFHSHRSQKPVPEYSSTGSTDDIYLRRADDLHAPEIRLTDFGWETGSPFWSPDGRKLLFHSWQRGGQPGIYKLFVLTLNPETGAITRAEMLPLGPEIHSAMWAAWSPDGQQIAVVDDRGSGKHTLWIIHSDGTHPQRLFDFQNPTFGGVDWAKDGKSLIFSALPASNAAATGDHPRAASANNTLQLFSFPITGGQLRQLTHDPANLMHPRISPDGGFIACTRIAQSKQIYRRPL